MPDHQNEFFCFAAKNMGIELMQAKVITNHNFFRQLFNSLLSLFFREFLLRFSLLEVDVL